MPPQPLQPNPNENTDALLEHLLVVSDDNSKHTNALLENMLEQGAKETLIEPLIENILEKLGDLGEKLTNPNFVVDGKEIAVDLSETNQLLREIKEELTKPCQIELKLT